MKQKPSNSVRASISLFVIALIPVGCGTLPEEGAGSAEKVFSVEEAFGLIAKENDVTRTLYTKAIVGEGKKNGLKFDENWEKDSVHAGPLPALFLRGISGEIKKSPVPLGLYLGSDFPVRKSNKFSGKQEELFQQMRKDTLPKFFYDSENSLYTAMFPDFAVSAACVTCHNEHKETMKNDWKLGDIMGATTWTYPNDSLTYKEVADIIAAYRKGTIETYNKYLDKAGGFPEVPEIGTTWPIKGYFLPTAQDFVDSVSDLASKATLSAMLKM